MTVVVTDSIEPDLDWEAGKSGTPTTPLSYRT